VKRVWMLAQRTWRGFGKDNASQMAAAITYYVLFAVVPLMIVLLSLATIMLDDERKNDIISAIEDNLNIIPDDVSISLDRGSEDTIKSVHGAAALVEIEAELEVINQDADRSDRMALAEQVEAGDAIEVSGYSLRPGQLTVHSESAVGKAMDRISGASEALGAVGFIVAALNASIAFSAIRRSLNVVWGAPHRPFVQARLMELSMLFGLVVLFGASITATTVVQLLAEASEGSQNPVSGVGGFLWFMTGLVLPWTLTFALVLLAYWLVPNSNNHLVDVWPAAALASLAIESLKYGYGVYVINFNSYGAVYGALGGILLFMFFVWLSSYIFLMGAELAFEYPGVMREEHPNEETPRAAPFRDTVVRIIKGLFFAGREK